VKRAEEKALIQRAKQGDKQAFALIYRETVQPIYRYVYRRTNNEQLAEDLTGDVFIKALEALPRYEDKGRPFLAWLYRIAHARVIDEYRRTDRRPDMQDIETMPIKFEQDMDEGLQQATITNILQKALSQLTDDQQQVIILRFIEGLSLEEVGLAMGKKANAIKALQHRAVRALGRELEKMDMDINAILASLG